MKQVRVFALLLAVLFVMIYLTPGFGENLFPGSASPRVTGFARGTHLANPQSESLAPTGVERGTSYNAGPPLPRSTGALWIEAEEESAFRVTSPESGERSSLHHFGESYWSLSGEGDWVEYSIQIPEEQMLYIWVRHLHKGEKPPYHGDLRIAVNGITMSTIPDHPTQGNGAWVWSRVGWGHMEKDRHRLRITKAGSRKGSALIDALFITPDENAHPPEHSSRNTSSG